MAALLSTNERRLFPEAKVIRLRNEKATTQSVRAAIVKVAAETKPGDLAVFYFSGPADRRERTLKGVTRVGYVLLLHDFDGKGGGILRPSDLLALLAPANAGQTLVILDI